MNKYIGSIEIICGPMFSGKTEELIKRAKKAITSKKNISVFKPSIDDRYSQDNIVSHNKNKIKCNIIDSAKEMLNFSLNTNIFFIDEAQFFDEGIIQVCKQLTNQGKKIIIAGLDKDYKAKSFGQMKNLMALSDNITKLKSVCAKCNEPASYSYRKTKIESQVLIGESEKYEPRCKKCYYNDKEKT